ncbi:hypothetical protein VF14_18945 [Nostoc linckia z18]|jgi:hypothetical protein|uniref:Peptidase C39-like domain-containing protein n=2 Tax=Nostoc linckia TaxID=92942 RepID=A0A9Q6EKZ9_NOSLI|nr:hypothetical protein [Nostoc linckia]PHK41551.1 hypothetical protein VF12_06325 [Nostoc linckia z15]PHK45132.1 hypothetical protein VF13_18180 [Nostoc linckia z16]PHJ58482.1 hypothetical protein VF02_27665 [Nostoc linckia z1]PHJ60749.1 hypothetical protein VF05_30075 [Nostoc linckia z3]PHJ65768.1 hypothetical protein VF03_27575 [Nostoc linckia z2]
MFEGFFSTFGNSLDYESDFLQEEMTNTTNDEIALEVESDNTDFDTSHSNNIDLSTDLTNLGSDNLSNFSCEFATDAYGDTSQFYDLGNPIADANCWQQQEGQNSCAVVAQIGIYESIAGVDISEAEACQLAEANGWFDPETGTYPKDVGKILNELGIPTKQSYDATLDDIATALEQGDKVIVGLDGNEIWTPMRDSATGSPIEQSNAGHAVWVTGIDREPDGSVKIILNDSGTADGQMKVVDAEDFLSAWADHGNFLMVADVPVNDSNQQLAQTYLGASAANEQANLEAGAYIDNQHTLGAEIDAQYHPGQDQLKQQAIEIAGENAAEYQRMAQYWRSQADISQNLADGSASNYHELEERINFERRLEKTADATGNEYTYTTSGIDAVSQTSSLLLSMDAQHNASMCRLKAQQYESLAAEAMSQMNSYAQMDASKFTEELVDNLASEQKNIEQQT